jgi:hypothetical protein
VTARDVFFGYSRIFDPKHLRRDVPCLNHVQPSCNVGLEGKPNSAESAIPSEIEKGFDREH